MFLVPFPLDTTKWPIVLRHILLQPYDVQVYLPKDLVGIFFSTCLSLFSVSVAVFVVHKNIYRLPQSYITRGPASATVAPSHHHNSNSNIEADDFQHVTANKICSFCTGCGTGQHVQYVFVCVCGGGSRRLIADIIHFKCNLFIAHSSHV